jgi:hypothetical protein
MKLKLLPVFIVFIIWIIGTSLNKYISHQQKNISLNLIITDIERTPTNQFFLYNNGNLIDLRNYTFMNYDNIKIGDSIVKNRKNDTLFFYRKNLSTGKYEENLTLFPN